MAKRKEVGSMNEKVKNMAEIQKQIRGGLGMLETKPSRSHSTKLKISPVDQAEERISGMEDTVEEIL